MLQMSNATIFLTGRLKTQNEITKILRAEVKFNMEKSVFETLFEIKVNDQPRASARKSRPEKLSMLIFDSRD